MKAIVYIKYGSPDVFQLKVVAVGTLVLSVHRDNAV